MESVASHGTFLSILANCWALLARGVAQHAIQTKAVGAKASEDVKPYVEIKQTSMYSHYPRTSMVAFEHESVLQLIHDLN